MRIFLLLSFCLICSTFSACSYLTFTDSNEGAKLTNSQIAASFIQSSVTVNEPWLGRYLFLTEYLKNQKLTAEEYNSRLLNLKNRWELANHPLANLKMVDVSVSEDNAYATFRRPSAEGKDFPLIKIDLTWTGSSWSVSDDNFLGKNELYDTYK